MMYVGLDRISSKPADFIAVWFLTYCDTEEYTGDTKTTNLCCVMAINILGLTDSS
jgi:hypothetical protein